MESDESIDAGNDQDVREEEDKDEIGEVLSEWKNHSEFKVRKFYRWLFPSALFSIYSLVAHTFLGVKYLNTGFILQSQNFTTDNPSCRNLTVEVLSNHSDWSDKRFYADHLYTCETQNLVFGIATLSIQFLPGIQWYTTLKVTKNHRLGRFLSSLLFPFFSILFKVTFKAIDFFPDSSSSSDCPLFPPRAKDCQDGLKGDLLQGSSQDNGSAGPTGRADKQF